MRLVIIKFGYPDYLRQFYARNPELRAQSYDAQKAALDYDAFWWGDSWTHALRPLGYDVIEIVMNAEPMQRAWARENGVEVDGVSMLTSVLGHQIRRLEPDVLFLQSFAGLSLETLRALREATPSLRAVVGWSGSIGNATARVIQQCDAIVSCIPELTSTLNASGHRCFHMNHAFDPRVMDRIGESPAEDIDFSFLGNLVDRKQHGERLGILREIGRDSELQVFTELSGRPAVVKAGWLLAAKAAYAVAQVLLGLGMERSTLQRVPLVGRSATWRYWPRYARTPVPRANIHEAVYGLRMLQTFRRSRVTLNVHSSISPRSASNIRMFEATGAGACLLTDWKENLGELFEIDREVVVYRSPAEAVERARWLLEHPAERRAIGEAASRRVGREHTFAHRAPILDEIIRGELARA